MVRISATARFPAIGVGEISKGKCKRDQKDDDADRTRRSKMKKLEGFKIAAEYDGFGTTGRAAFGEQENDRKRASEGPNRDEERQHDRHVTQPRERDVPEAQCRSRAVNARGFVMIGRDGLQAREEHDRPERKKLPDRD